MKKALFIVLGLIVLFSPVMLYNFAIYTTRAKEGQILRNLSGLHRQQLEFLKKNGGFSQDLKDFKLEDLPMYPQSYFGFSEKCVSNKENVIYSFDLPGTRAEWDYDLLHEKPVLISEVPGAREQIAKIFSEGVECRDNDYTLTWMENRPTRPHLTGIYRVDATGSVKIIETIVPTFTEFYVKR